MSAFLNCTARVWFQFNYQSSLPIVELFTLILEPSQEPLSRALRESEVIFTCNSDFKRVPSPLDSGGGEASPRLAGDSDRAAQLIMRAPELGGCYRSPSGVPRDSSLCSRTWRVLCSGGDQRNMAMHLCQWKDRLTFCSPPPPLF